MFICFFAVQGMDVSSMFAQIGALIVRIGRDMHICAIIVQITYAHEKTIYGLKKTIYGSKKTIYSLRLFLQNS